MIKDNRGVSLVELIVAVLILMVIVTPTLMAFQTAMKSTEKATDITYADTASQTVLEEVKYLGRTGVESVVQDSTQTRWRYVSEGGYYALSNNSHGYYEEGTGEYSVRVYFDNTDYASANEYEYSDLSSFASEHAEIINPNVTNMDYDNLAEQFFLRQYMDYKKEEWNEKWRQYEADYLDYQDRLLAGEDVSGIILVEPGPFTDPRDETDEYGNPLFVESDFLKCISKEQVLITTPNRTSEGGYVLSTRITYNFDSANSYGYRCTRTERVFESICEKVISADVDTLYVLYKPKDPTLLRGIDRVTVINVLGDDGEGERDEIRVFIIVQADASIDYSENTTGTLDVMLPHSFFDGTEYIDNITDNLYIHSQAKLSFSIRYPRWNSNDLPGNERLITKDADQERICNVEVRILPKDCTAPARSTEEQEQTISVQKSTVVK